MVNRTFSAIIQSFNNLIAEHEFQKISVDMIMQGAGVSRSTFYRYFKDKYDVMNANYKHLLDHYLHADFCSSYRDLCYHLFTVAQNNMKLFKRAMESTGFNSFSNFIYEYSYKTALDITKQNRGGEGFSSAEELQVDVFCNGICAVFKNIVFQKYMIDAATAADALYEMMPDSLKHYWLKENTL